MIMKEKKIPSPVPASPDPPPPPTIMPPLLVIQNLSLIASRHGCKIDNVKTIRNPDGMLNFLVNFSGSSGDELNCAVAIGTFIEENHINDCSDDSKIKEFAAKLGIVLL